VLPLHSGPPRSDASAAPTTDVASEEPAWTRRRRDSRVEIAAAIVLLAATGVGGVCFAHGTRPSWLDTWFPSFIGSGHRSVLTDVTALRYPLVIVIGAVGVAAIAFPRDRLRALACLVGPPLALVTSELVIKPWVGRTLGGGLSYPSGSTVGASALGTALVLAVPVRRRTVAVVAASAYALWMAVAVVSLQWHYPTDAAAGLAYGTGVVLLLDGVACRVVDVIGRHRPAGSPPRWFIPTAVRADPPADGG
jgi:membrane-associated phospholipid phosphatase